MSFGVTKALYICDARSPCAFACRFATEYGVAPVVVSDSQADWFHAGDYTFQKLLDIIGPRDVFAKRAGKEPCTQVCAAAGA